MWVEEVTTQCHITNYSNPARGQWEIWPSCALCSCCVCLLLPLLHNHLPVVYSFFLTCFFMCGSSCCVSPAACWTSAVLQLSRHFLTFAWAPVFFVFFPPCSWAELWVWPLFVDPPFTFPPLRLLPPIAPQKAPLTLNYLPFQGRKKKRSSSPSGARWWCHHSGNYSPPRDVTVTVSTSSHFCGSSKMMWKW